MPAWPRSRCATPPRWRSPNSTIRTSSSWSRTTAARAPGAQQAAQQALDEGAEIILGPLFAPFGRRRSVRLARARNIPVIAFSTDANVAARGVYLLSFLPESDVDRIVGYAVEPGQAVVRRAASPTTPTAPWSRPRSSRWSARRGGRIVALERYPLDHGQMAGAGADGRAGGRARRRDLHPGRRRCGAGGGADARRQRRRYQAPCSCSAPACGTIRASSPIPRSTAAGMRRPTPPASGISRRATAPATTRIRCAPRRSPTTRSRWSPRWSRRRARSASPKRC